MILYDKKGYDIVYRNLFRKSECYQSVPAIDTIKTPMTTTL